MAGSKPSKNRGKPMNRAKRARRDMATRTNSYKGDGIKAVCSTFVDDTSVFAAPQAIATNKIQGALANSVQVDHNQNIEIAMCLPLDARVPIFANPRHSVLTHTYNEWNTQAVYLDLLFTPKLREFCDQVFLLVERGVPGVPTSETNMVSDVNCRMYQLGNNTQKLTFKHVFNTAQDKINKKSLGQEIPPNETYYLKILCKGKNTGAEAIPVGEAQIKLRSKFFNTYTDMKVLSTSAGANGALTLN